MQKFSCKNSDQTSGIPGKAIDSLTSNQTSDQSGHVSAMWRQVMLAATEKHHTVSYATRRAMASNQHEVLEIQRL